MDGGHLHSSKHAYARLLCSLPHVTSVMWGISVALPRRITPASLHREHPSVWADGGLFYTPHTCLLQTGVVWMALLFSLGNVFYLCSAVVSCFTLFLYSRSTPCPRLLCGLLLVSCDLLCSALSSGCVGASYCCHSPRAFSLVISLIEGFLLLLFFIL